MDGVEYLNIAELFINLGIKGSEKTVGALGNVKKGLGEAKSMSLEAKAGIAAVIYGLEKLMSASAQMGTGLTNFASLTGLSAKSLQQWQYAARQAGVSGEELTGSLKAVQTSMTNMLLGKGAPEGMGMLARTVGFDPKKIKDTFYVMEKLQEFARRAPPELAQSVVKSFGVSEGVIAAMRRNAFRPDVFKKAPTYSDKEIGQLDKVNVAWSNLGNKIQMAMGHFTSKHGMQLVGDLSKITDQVVKLSEAFMKLAEKLKLFEWIGKVFEGWTLIFEGATKGVGTMSKLFGNDKEQGQGKKEVMNFMSGMGEAFKGMAIMAEEKLQEWHGSSTPVNTAKAITPRVGTPVKGGNQQHIQVQQTLQFQHDGKDHKKTGDSVHKAVRDSYRQLSAQSQGS